jgi:mono/diheme cytochrome c family protein
MRPDSGRLGREWLPKSRVAAFAAGCAATLLIFVVGGLLLADSGVIDVAASNPHGRLIYWVTHNTMRQSVRFHARNLAAPAHFDRGQVIAGFCAYEAHCVACHGALSVGRDRWANGLTPNPPYLIDAARDWTPSELHWIIEHGVKMTAMPAWDTSLPQKDIWNLVAFLETANRQPGAYVRLRAANICTPPRQPS